MLYFIDRAQAGRELADRLLMYEKENTTVIALSESSAVVAAQVAMKLHCGMALYMVKDINLPNEANAAAAFSSTGAFQYNSMYSAGQIDELVGEYRGWFEEQRIQKNHELNMLLGENGTIRKEMLRHHVVIVVADGIASGFTLDMVNNFLRTIAIKKVVVATPIASVDAVDRMHVVADDVVCLNVTPNFMGVEHYYEKGGTTTVDDALKIMKNISLSWKNDDGLDGAAKRQLLN